MGEFFQSKPQPNFWERVTDCRGISAALLIGNSFGPGGNWNDRGECQQHCAVRYLSFEARFQEEAGGERHQTHLPKLLGYLRARARFFGSAPTGLG